MTKVLVVATSRKTRGGITSVVKAHEMGRQWKDFHCKWIETHIDKNAVWKLCYFLKGWLHYIVLLPFYDIVHVHTSEPLSAIRKCFFVPFARLLRKRVIVHFHAFSPDTTIHGNRKCLYGYLFATADKVIVLSEFWKRTVNETFYLEDKVQVIYNPCTSNILPGNYPKKKYILYAGTINARKGYADMIKAFSRVASKYPDWKIVFAGNGEIEQGKALALECGIERQTVFSGWVDGPAKDKIFKESAVFCLPSHAEGFPMAVLDAWAYGLPVITTPVGGIPDVAVDGENLLLFCPGDIDTLASRMDLMMGDEVLRERVHKSSVCLAATRFNQDTINREIANLYISLQSGEERLL